LGQCLPRLRARVLVPRRDAVASLAEQAIPDARRTGKAGVMAPKPRARHHDTTFRPLATGIGNDDWQRQADAAAWSAVSGMHPSLFLGWLEPIPIPPELRAQLREAGKALAAEPSAARADALLRLAHEAVYGKPDASTPIAAATEAAGGVSDDWWSDTPANDEKALAASLEAFCAEAATALANREPDPIEAAERAAVFGSEERAEWWQ
jgi:hypothetical protein